METQASINYHRIAEAIAYINNNFRGQPNLDEVAEKIHLSPAHFQRLFNKWGTEQTHHPGKGKFNF